MAWNGSLQAGEALRAAVPLLALASEVILLEVDDGTLEAPVEEAAQYLSRHGIEPVVRRATTAIASASDVILADVAALDADYVVMGGYGRSRLAETLFGGVTRRMLAESRCRCSWRIDAAAEKAPIRSNRAMFSAGQLI
ncbi:MAG: universal stress protein [Sphingomonas sp.]